MEAVAQEVAPFGIQMTLIEPGPTATGFGGALDQADALPAYTDTPSGAIRSALFGEVDASYTVRPAWGGVEPPHGWLPCDRDHWGVSHPWGGSTRPVGR